jgi:2',3'-cyclic-nucleotide 2'-phosphodiesterase (5'-nucleotidase family)
VTFDEAGHVKDAHGAPIVLAATNDAPDAAFEAKLSALRAPVKSKANEALGATAHALTKATHGQSDLGALFADAMLEATRGRGRDSAVVALAEPDARADLPAGNVTFAQLYEAWPFETPVMLADLSGAELESVVAHGLSLDPPAQIAGITARVTKRDAKGAVRIVDLRVGGKKIARDRRYLVAVDEYVAKGNDDYAVFAAASARGAVNPAGVTVRDAVARALHAHSPVAPKVDGRVVE